VAVSMEGDADAWEVVLIRGTVRTGAVEGVAAEYGSRGPEPDRRGGRKDPPLPGGYRLPEDDAGLHAPGLGGILDFATRLPSARSSGSRMSSVKHVQFRRLTWR
jgi:hypothetical protein